MATPDYVKASLAGLLAGKDDYDIAAAFFEGTRGEVITSKKLRLMFGDTAEAFRVNYARTPVDVLLERIQIQGISGSDATAVRLAQQAWLDNELGIEAKDVHRRMFEFGDSYLIGWPDDELPSGASLYAQDPRNVRVFYNPNRPRVKDHAIHAWMEKVRTTSVTPQRRLRVNLYFPDHVEQWVSQTTSSENIAEMGNGLYPFEDEDSPHEVESPVPGTIPVFHFRNGRPYGRPEHADAYGPQDMLNKLTITMMTAVDFAGYPQRYVLTDSSLDNNEPADAFEQPLPTDADYQGLDPQSSMEAGPGSTWLLSGSKLAVGQFPSAQTSNFLDAIHSLIRQMSAVTDIPLNYYDRSGQQPSGESFRMADRPLDNKTRDRQALAGVTWNEVFNFVSALNSVGPSDVGVEWATGRMVDDKDSWETAQLQIAAGVPSDQVILERGYAPDVVASWAPQPSPDGVDQSA